MLLHHIILAMLWILYCVLHSVLASTSVKRRLRRRMKNDQWYRLWYTLFAFIGLVALIVYQVSIATPKLFEPPVFLLAVGAVISFAGLVLMMICIRKYFMSLSGLRSLFIENYANELQIRGVHQYVRHPLYLGTFAFIWGLFLVLPFLSFLVANLVITIYTLIAIRFEEEKLLAEFGDQYQQYRKTVPKLIPFLKAGRQV